MRTKNIIISIFITLLVFGYIFNSCSKNNFDKALDKNAAITKSLTTNYFYSLYNDNGYSKMTVIKNSNGEVSITTVEDNIPSNPLYKSVIYDSIQILTYDTISIPNDGKQYWIISFHPDEDFVYKAVAGDRITHYCDCPNDGTCVIKGKLDLNNGISETWCEDEDCGDCCSMRVKIPSNTPIETKSIIIISANKISYAGQTYYK